MVFEGSSDKMNIVGQQRRGQRVTLISLIGPIVEGKVDRLAAVNATAAVIASHLWGRGAFEQALCCHDALPFLAPRRCEAGFAAASAALSRRHDPACAALPAFDVGRLPIG